MAAHVESQQYDIWNAVPFDTIAKPEWASIQTSPTPFEDDVKNIFNSSTSKTAPSIYENNVLTVPNQHSTQEKQHPHALVEEFTLSELIRDLKATSFAPKEIVVQPPTHTPAKPVPTVGARYLRVGKLPCALQPGDAAAFFTQQAHFGAVRAIFTDHLATYGFIVIAFHDSRDAADAAHHLRFERGFGRLLDTECLTRGQLMLLTSTAHRIMSDSEGEVQIDVLCVTSATPPNSRLVESALRTTIQSDIARDVAAFHIEQADHSHFRARCTFFDDRAALQAVLHMQGLDLFGCRFTVSLIAQPSMPSRPPESALYAKDLSNFVNPFTLHASPMPTPAISHPAISQRVSIGSPIRGRHSVPRDNIIDLEAIEMGLDSRTTVMMKNLPHHMTDTRLLEIVSKATPRSFDFLYVRIDFSTASSVGYAFVNFLAPMDIVRFGRARLGTRWDTSTSDKQVYMSYANIQGKAALINRFRNSDVMDRPASFQPKIFFSGGPNVGLPEVFPERDFGPYGARRLHNSMSEPILSPRLPGTEALFFR